MVLAWNARSIVAAALWGLLLSVVIEIAQIYIPGRDPALADILFNALGAAIGAFLGKAHRIWLTPSSSESRALALVSLIVVGWVMLLTAVLLAPIVPAAFSSARVEDDLVVHYETRASELGLDEPDFWLRGAFINNAAKPAVPLSLHREKTRWYVTKSNGESAVIGPTIGEGWTLLAYPDAIARRWSNILDGVWMLVLCLPIGFWARGALRPIAGATVIALLVLIPQFTGIVETTALAWAGAATGFLAGWLLVFAA
jgi:hypothetical protein